jgi:hypothetical protein
MDITNVCPLNTAAVVLTTVQSVTAQAFGNVIKRFAA